MTGEQEPATRVTLGAIYSLVLELKEDLGGIPAKVSDHEVRIRAIERYLWIWIGAAGVIGAGAGQFVSFLLNR